MQNNKTGGPLLQCPQSAEVLQQSSPRALPRTSYMHPRKVRRHRLPCRHHRRTAGGDGPGSEFRRQTLVWNGNIINRQTRYFRFRKLGVDTCSTDSEIVLERLQTMRDYSVYRSTQSTKLNTTLRNKPNTTNRYRSARTSLLLSEVALKILP